MKLKTVLVDIDGTVSKVGDRLKYLQQDKPDWDKFYDSCFEDEPIQEIVDLVQILSKRYHIVFCTGRRESVRDVTVKWLFDNGLGDYKALLMRPNGDKTHDIVMKPDLIKMSGIKLKDIAFILEDRNSMVVKYRSMGLKCLQVAEGDF